MQNIPDIFGMKMSAATRMLDAAGICCNIEIIKPVFPSRHNDRKPVSESCMQKLEPVERVVRVKRKDDGTLVLTVCSIDEPQTAEVAE